MPSFVPRSRLGRYLGRRLEECLRILRTVGRLSVCALVVMAHRIRSRQVLQVRTVFGIPLCTRVLFCTGPRVRIALGLLRVWLRVSSGSGTADATLGPMLRSENIWRV
jgi:hypothetical protein